MQPNLVGLIIGVVGTIVTVGVAVGLPALAIIAIKYFKFRERELTLEMEYRHQSQQKGLDIEQRVQRLEDALSSLDHDVRMRLGIGRSQVSISHAELFEVPAAPEAEQGPLDPVPIKAR